MPMKPFFDISVIPPSIGPSSGGSTAKLANQMIVNNPSQSSQAFVFAAKAGAGQEGLSGIRGHGARSWMPDPHDHRPQLQARRPHPHQPQDIKNTNSAMRSTFRFPTPHSLEIMQYLKIHGHMNDDHGGIAVFKLLTADKDPMISSRQALSLQSDSHKCPRFASMVISIHSSWPQVFKRKRYVVSADVLTSYKKVMRRRLTPPGKEIAANNKKIVVLDDDPTGVRPYMTFMSTQTASRQHQGGL